MVTDCITNVTPNYKFVQYQQACEYHSLEAADARTPAARAGYIYSEKIVLSTIQYTVQKGRLGVACNPATWYKVYSGSE